MARPPETEIDLSPGHGPAPEASGATQTTEDWFETSLGAEIVQREIERVKSLVPSGYYAESLQVGLPKFSFAADLGIRRQFVVDTQPPRSDPSGSATPSREYFQGSHVSLATSEALPFADRSMDLVVLPHTLDFSRQPHEVLRQVNQVLRPEGHLAIVGFNSLSLFGALHSIRRGGDEHPWNGRLYTVGRVQDWLSLLGYDIVGAGMLGYSLPVQSERWRSRFSFLEQAGDRWFPGFGSQYVIVGRKKEIAMTPTAGRTRRWHQLLPGIAQPASQRAARIGLRLVEKN